MLYRIIDIIADRDLAAMGRLVGVMALFMVAALLGWLIMGF
ncbi:MAG TPA: hypothetical protein VKK81_07730 [Candidatus Binatia bacterium]|nr:hypothetical protein [Candidatus Binatia bacterium]